MVLLTQESISAHNQTLSRAIFTLSLSLYSLAYYTSASLSRLLLGIQYLSFSLSISLSLSLSLAQPLPLALSHSHSVSVASFPFSKILFLSFCLLSHSFFLSLSISFFLSFSLSLSLFLSHSFFLSFSQSIFSLAVVITFIFL